jgi:hypothetical protein
MLVLSAAQGHAQRTTTANAAAALDKTSSAPVLAVARMIAEDTWSPLLDKRVQQSPAGRPFGAAWTSADSRWQKARAALGARMTNILTAYATSNQTGRAFHEEADRIGAGPDLDGAIAALGGPPANSVVHAQARQAYIVSTMTARPDGPAAGTPAWQARLKELGQQFDQRAGPDVPPNDPARAPDVEKLASGPAWRTLSRIWTFALSNATRQIDTAMNLMLFDDQAGIERDIAAAAGAPPAAAKGAGTAGGKTEGFDLERMATCKDSWLEWGNDESRVGAFRDGFRRQFKEADSGGYFVPISRGTLLGMNVARVYSSTIGMARGFSVAVEAPFETTKKNVEKSLGAPLKQCETSDGMRTCNLTIAEKKTVMLMADATGKEKTTLVGCFYFYEK